MNPCDLSEILDRLGYYINDDTGEVMLDPEYELGFYLPNWTCFNSMEEYCKVFPYEQQCKCYDI